MTSRPFTSGSDVRSFDWVVVNQSQSPTFQKMLERVTERLGSALLLTGQPFEPQRPARLTVRAGPTYNRRSKLSRARSWAAFTMWATAQLATLRGAPLLLAVSNPPFNENLAWLMHRARGWPYALLVWDIYPEHMVRRRWLTEGGWTHRGWQRAHERALGDAAAVVTIGDRMAERLDAAGKRGGRTEVVPNWADVEWIRPIPKSANPFARQQGQTGKFTVLYSGNLGATHGLGAIAEAARFTRDDARVHYLVVGEGMARAHLEQQVAGYDLRNVTFLPSQPWDAIPQSLAAADVGIVALEPGSEDLSVPSKTYNLLAAGVPILALGSPTGEVCRLVEGHGVGCAIPAGDAKALAEVVTSLSRDEARVRSMATAARALAVERFSEEAVVERFAEILGRARGCG